MNTQDTDDTRVDSKNMKCGICGQQVIIEEGGNKWHCENCLKKIESLKKPEKKSFGDLLQAHLDEFDKAGVPVESTSQLDVADTLAARNSTHGDWTEQALRSHSLKLVMRKSINWDKLSASQQEALDIITVKISRILTGDPNHADSWHDIAGYATLVERELS